MSRNLILFAGVAALYLFTGLFYSWNLSLNILNLGILSAIMALGINIQWGYAGLFSTGIVGSVALGGLAVVLVSANPVPAGFAAGGPRILAALGFAVVAISAISMAYRRMAPGRARSSAIVLAMVLAFFVFRLILDPGVSAVEANSPEQAGNIGGLGWNPLLAWPAGALLAAGAAWVIGKVALGLREDYLAIATLGIAEIVVAVLKNEDWLARGVKNLGLNQRPWPVPYEVDMQLDPGFLSFAQAIGADPVTASTITVKLLYAAMFTAVLIGLVVLMERALNSPWGRMMRAIRDNEAAASAMGKHVTRRHLQVFILGSAAVGLAGAMYTSMISQINPGEYIPLRFTFLIWVMVIVGGSGNNWGSVLGGLLIGWLYFIVEDFGPRIMGLLTTGLPAGDLRDHLIDSSQHLRLVTLGVILLLVLRFSPKGLLPEK